MIVPLHQAVLPFSIGPQVQGHLNRITPARIQTLTINRNLPLRPHITGAVLARQLSSSRAPDVPAPPRVWWAKRLRLRLRDRDAGTPQ